MSKVTEQDFDNIKNNKGCFANFYLVFIFGWLSIALLLYNAYVINLTQNWTPTVAILESVEVDVRNSSSDHTNYYLELDYVYQIDSIFYHGNRLAKSISSFNRIDRIESLRLIKKLQYAKKIQVFYNPKNPIESVVINQFTNKWFTWIWIVVFINSLIYGLKFAAERRNKGYLLFPVLVLLALIFQSLTKVKYVDNLKMITVFEHYDPTDCKYVKEALDEDVYIKVNNYRMTKNHELFNQMSDIRKVNIIDNFDNPDGTFQCIAEVNYFHQNGNVTMKFRLQYNKVDGCWFSFKSMESMD